MCCRSVPSARGGLLPARLFLCYAREDHKWAELLRSHLRPLETTNYLTAFIDGEIEPGSNWNEEIRNQLANADVFLAITSVNLLNSRYAMNVEVPSALDRHMANRLKLVPVIADYCNWEATPLGSLQAVPRGSNGDIKPLVDWSNPNVPLTTVAKLLQEMTAGHSETRMASPPPDRGRDGLFQSHHRTMVPPVTPPPTETRTVSARSAEMLDLAFASATSLIARSSDPAMWVERLRQRIGMVVRVDADWSVRYEKDTEMMVEGAGAIIAAPFKITAQADVISRLSLFDVDARYEEVGTELQPLMFPAQIQGPARGFVVVFSPPVTAARERKFRTWFAVDREFAPSLGQGTDDQLTCSTIQLAHEHSAELEFCVLVSAKLPQLELIPEFMCERTSNGERAIGYGEPYRRYVFRAPAQPVDGRLAQTIRLRLSGK
jgi:hypothetical protein